MLTMQLNKGNGIIYSLSRYNDGSREISSISTINKINNDKYYGIKSAFRFDLKSFENGICIQEVSYFFRICSRIYNSGSAYGKGNSCENDKDIAF